MVPGDSAVGTLCHQPVFASSFSPWFDKTKCTHVTVQCLSLCPLSMSRIQQRKHVWYMTPTWYCYHVLIGVRRACWVSSTLPYSPTQGLWLVLLGSILLSSSTCTSPPMVAMSPLLSGHEIIPAAYLKPIQCIYIMFSYNIMQRSFFRGMLCTSTMINLLISLLFKLQQI